MYNYNDIQNMIERVNNDGTADKILSHIQDYDKGSVRNVLKSGYYETFDRYDSDVCEQFITAYENEYCLPF